MYDYYFLWLYTHEYIHTCGITLVYDRYKVMRRCWSINSDDRPTFGSINKCITDMLERVHLQMGDAQKNTNISTVYVNLTKCSGYTYENLETI